MRVIDLNEPHAPTPSDLLILLHWWLMTLHGSVLAMHDFDQMRLTAVNCDDWHERWRLV